MIEAVRKGFTKVFFFFPKSELSVKHFTVLFDSVVKVRVGKEVGL